VRRHPRAHRSGRAGLAQGRLERDPLPTQGLGRGVGEGEHRWVDGDDRRDEPAVALREVERDQGPEVATHHHSRSGAERVDQRGGVLRS
jgi:hypothetical protein